MDKDDLPAPRPTKPASQTTREARAAAALRENLRRRKAQSRARTEATDESLPPPVADNPFPR